MADITPTLMGLPAKLRSKILRFALIDEEVIPLMFTASRTPEPQLLRVCKDIRKEALPIFYENTFEGTIAPLSKLVRNVDRRRKIQEPEQIKAPQQLRVRHDPHPEWGSLQVGTKSRWLKDFAVKRTEILRLRGHEIGALDVYVQFPLRHPEAGLVRGTIEELNEHDVVDRDGKRVWNNSSINSSKRSQPQPLIILETGTDMADIISPFMRLPPEIRNSICDLVLIHDEPIILRPYGTDHIDEPALLRTNHQIRRDSRPIYFGMNTFVGSVYELTRFVRTVERNHKLPVLKHLRCDNDNRDRHDRKVHGSVDQLEKDCWLKAHINSVLAISAGLNKDGLPVPRIEFPLRHGQAGIVWGTILELRQYGVVVRDGQHAWVRSEQSYEDVAAALALFAIFVDGAWDDLPTV
ncbi:hypothetical protein LTS10_000430 [Elasticomyces elasticus]|nr:hypothetical protein LTS10_000430 [Elasticomyces elasticus]